MAEPEIEDFHPFGPSSYVADADVARLQIAMNELGGMTRRDAAADCESQIDRLLNGQGQFDQGAEVSACHVLDDKIRSERRIAKGVDSDHGPMLNRSERVRLPTKSLKSFIVDMREHLDCGITLECKVPGFVDDAHAALPDLRADLVFPVDHLTRREHYVV